MVSGGIPTIEGDSNGQKLQEILHDGNVFSCQSKKSKVGELI